MKVYKVEIMVIDFDNLGATGIATQIENVNYPNDCISPRVMSVKSREVEWTDSHPLNNEDTVASAFNKLFNQ